MKKRWIARVLLCILLLSLSFSAVSCANEDEAKVLKEAEALLDAAFTVNEIYLGSGIAHNENGRYIGSYYEADKESLEKYGVETLSDIQAKAAAVYSMAVCAQLQSTVLTALQVDGQLISPKRYYDLEEKGKTLLMVASTYEPLGVGTNSYENCRVLWAKNGKAEISLTMYSHYEDNPVQSKENLVLSLVKENGAWRLDDLAVRFYDTYLLEQ